MRKFEVYDPKKGKQVFVGMIDGDTLIKKVKPKHFFVKTQSYGIQESALQKLLEQGGRRVLIREESGRKLSAPLKVWLEKGKVKDWGHGEQRFLPIELMVEV